MKDGWKTLSQPQEKMAKFLLLGWALWPPATEYSRGLGDYQIKATAVYLEDLPEIGFPIVVHLHRSNIVQVPGVGKVEVTENVWMYGMDDFSRIIYYRKDGKSIHLYNYEIDLPWGVWKKLRWRWKWYKERQQLGNT